MVEETYDLSKGTIGIVGVVIDKPNVKCQSSKFKSNPNEMPKQVRHDKNVILNSFQNPFLNFGIHLTFEFAIRSD